MNVSSGVQNFHFQRTDNAVKVHTYMGEGWNFDCGRVEKRNQFREKQIAQLVTESSVKIILLHSLLL